MYMDIGHTINDGLLLPPKTDGTRPQPARVGETLET